MNKLDYLLAFCRSTFLDSRKTFSPCTDGSDGRRGECLKVKFTIIVVRDTLELLSSS